MGKVMVGLITLHLIGAYGLILNTPEVALESALNIESRRAPLFWRISLRTLFVMYTTGVSILLKSSFPPFVELVSVMTVTFTTFVLPCVLYLKISAMAGTPLSIMEQSWNYFIITTAVIGAGFGAVSAIQDLMAAF